MIIATFNMENLDNTDGLWLARKQALSPMLERINADILLLQEIHKIDALKDLILGTKYEDYDIIHTTDKNGMPFAVRNLVILSRWEITDHFQYWHEFAEKPKWKKITAFPGEQEKDITWERPIQYAKIRLEDNKLLHVINLHLKSMNPTDINGQLDEEKWYQWKSHSGWAEGFFISSIKRVGQALETRILIDNIFGNEENPYIVVGGDFNSEIGSVPFKAIVGSVQDTQNPALSGKVMIPCELNIPTEQRYSLIHHGKGNMLDHLIVSQALYPRWERTAIFNEILPDESLQFATDKNFPESDHAPVIAYFRI